MALTPKVRVKEEAPPVKEVSKDTSSKEASRGKGVSSEVAKGFDVAKKIQEIQASNLPESEKREYIARLTGNKVDAIAANRVPFTVWANSRNIRQNIRVGMLAFPKAKGVADATFEEWDTIFKDF
jgi:hypothetical protein